MKRIFILIKLASAMLGSALAGSVLFNSALAQNRDIEVDPPPKMDIINVIATMHDRHDERLKNSSTATKVPFALKDIPQTIDSVNVDHAKMYGEESLNSMLNNLPGVDTTYDMRDEGIMIRGFDASDGDIYRDGIRASGQVRQSTANIERVEVLKGPASVLYGRGAGGGIINMISKQANFDSRSTLNLRGGSWDKYGGMVDINHPLSDKLAVRLTVDHESSDSFRKNIHQRDNMVSPSFLFDNLAGFTWLVQYTQDNLWRRPDRGPEYKDIPHNVSIKTSYVNPHDYVEDRLKTWRSVMGYQFNDDWSIKLTNAYRRASQNFDHYFAGIYCQADGTLVSGGKCNYNGKFSFKRAWQQTANKVLSNSLDLVGKFSTATVQHELLIGGEFNIERRDPKIWYNNRSDNIVALNPYHPHWPTEDRARGPLKSDSRHKATSKGFYWQDLISFTAQWKILAGLRYDQYEFATHDRLKQQHRSYDGHSLSPRVGLIWQPVEPHSFYLSYSKNFAPYGGRGMISLSANPTTVYDAKPQYSRQYEVGIKSDWLDNQISSQLALYDLEKYNVRYQPDATNHPFDWAVRGKEGSYGIELTVVGKLSDQWYINSGVGYQQAKVRQDRQNPQNKDNYLANTSRNSGHLTLRYLPDDHWFTELGVNYKGSMYNDADNLSQRGGYATWNAAVGYQTHAYDITLAVTNLLGKEYWRSSSMPGAPRAVFMTGSYKF